MKKKHLWFLLPTVFAIAFAEIAWYKMNIALSIITLVGMAYTFFIALTKQD